MKPSDYMEIEDPRIALQLDYAIAYKHRLKDQEYEASKLESIQSMLTPIGKALGVEYKGKASPTEPERDSKALPDDLPVEEVLRLIGGKKTMVVNHGK